MDTSCAIARIVYSSTDKANYRAKMIRFGANYFQKFGEFPIRTHGKNSKVISLILDEDISMQCVVASTLTTPFPLVFGTLAMPNAS